jgi:LysM repeat protein
MDKKNSAGSGRSKAKKMALLGLPLALVGPTIAELPASANSEQSPTTDKTDHQDLAVSSNNKQVAANLPTIKSSPVSSYRVKSGDTVSAIAKRFNVSVGKIAKLNNLGPTSLIRVGQELKISGNLPKPDSTTTTTYKVKSGDTLTKIAKRFNLTLSELVSINKLKSSAIIFPGQKLFVSKLIPVEEQASSNVTPERYLVAAGDTLKLIAKKFGISIESIRKANNFNESSIIYVGQELYLKPSSAPKQPSQNNQEQVTQNPVSQTPQASVLDDGVSEADPMRPSGACQVHGYHTVKAGETISKIAGVYGVSTQSVLTANSLTWSSTIYIGQRIEIPGVHEIQFCPAIVKMTNEMVSNAEVIYRVGKKLGISDYGVVIALATAMQESSLKNINYGDRDSVGLFQQRTSQGWGTIEQIMNPEYSARAFYGGPSGPNYKKIRGLLDIPNWSTLTVTKAAQAVQVSAFPDAYAKWELSAWSWLDQIAIKISNNG